MKIDEYQIRVWVKLEDDESMGCADCGKSTLAGGEVCIAHIIDGEGYPFCQACATKLPDSDLIEEDGE